jgi:hypothetical protein
MMNLRKMTKDKERGPGAPGSRFIPIGLLAGPAGGVVTSLLKNWKVALFGILLAIITYQNTVSFEILRPFGVRTIPGLVQDHEKELAKARREVRIAQEQAIECDLSRERLKGEIAATNAQVEKWVALSNKLRADQGKLSEELLKLKQQGEQEVQIILEGPIPQSCDGAMKLLREAITNGDLKW